MSTLRKETQELMVSSLRKKVAELNELAKSCAAFGISVEFMLNNHRDKETGNCYQSADVTTASWLSGHG